MIVPFVTIATPTYNRLRFIPYIIKCVMSQTYPKDKLEWIIVDDGKEKCGHLVEHIPQVRYFSFDSKMTIGAKRKFIGSIAKGEIIVNMDDDDYYPPERISHAVDVLMNDDNILLAGCIELYIWFMDKKELLCFRSNNPESIFNGSFAFKTKLLTLSDYNDNDKEAEGHTLRSKYKGQIGILDAKKSILVLAHATNTINKDIFLKVKKKHNEINEEYIREIVQDKSYLDFIL